MKLILNLQQFPYTDYLDSKADILTVGLRDFSSGYYFTYSVQELPSIIKEIHDHNKQIYLSINMMLNEEKIESFLLIFNEIASLDIDGFVVNDWGVLETFKESKIFDKVIFNPVTTITNKYSANIANNLGINHVVIANELNLKDLIETVNYCKGHAEILAQGYYQICNSKRHLISSFFKKFKIKDDSKYYKIKEESRDYAYPIVELNDEVLVFIDRERCILPYFEDLKKTKIEYIRIDTIFLDKEETDLYLNVYSDAIKNSKTIKDNLELLKSTNSNFSSLDITSILRKGD